MVKQNILKGSYLSMLSHKIIQDTKIMLPKVFPA